MKLGYARVSTADQDLAIQRVRLHEAGCVKLFEEKTSGARKKRPELERLLAELRADDVVVVTRLDRLVRSTSGTRDGIAEARLRGRKPGCPPLDPETVSAAEKLIEAGLSPARAAKQLGIGRATAYRLAAAMRDGASAPLT